MKKFLFLLPLIVGCVPGGTDPDYLSTYKVKCYSGVELLIEDEAQWMPSYRKEYGYRWVNLQSETIETSLDCIVTKIPPKKTR